MTSSAQTLRVSGREMAVLLNSALLVRVWEFDAGVLARHADTVTQVQRGTLAERLSESNRRALTNAELDDSRTLTREIMTARGALVVDVCVTESERRLLANCLSLCREEFSSHWFDFLGGMLAGMNWLDVTPLDLRHLEERLLAEADA